MIDERAVIDPRATLAPGVTVGPFSVIGPEVTIGEGTVVGPHVVIKGPTTIGKNNRIFQFASIGEDPQDLKFHGERTVLEIGDGNTIREYCTFNRGTGAGGGVTRVGSNNLFMAYVHVAHDCIIGSGNVFANSINFAGHVVIEDHVLIGGSSVVMQFLRIGSHSFVGGFSMVKKDIPPYVLAEGRPVEEHGINAVGLKRRGYSTDDIQDIKRAYKIFYRQGLMHAEAKLQLQPLADKNQHVKLFLDFLQAPSKHGVIGSAESVTD